VRLSNAVAQGYFWDRRGKCDNRDKSIIRPNTVSRSKILVEQHLSLTEQRLKVLAKTLLSAPLAFLSGQGFQQRGSSGSCEPLGGRQDLLEPLRVGAIICKMSRITHRRSCMTHRRSRLENYKASAMRLLSGACP
jgi:hypothetical protein